MATLARVALVPVGANFAGATVGQAAGFQAATLAGDLIPISSGRGTLITFRTAGTGAVVTFVSPVLSNYGTAVNPTMTLAATDEQEVFIANDGGGRFDQQPTNPQLLSVTYSSVTTLTVKAKTIP